MPRISTDNYDTVASWNGSQDLFVVEQPNGTKVATPAMVKQFIEAGDFEATGEVKDGHGNVLADMAKADEVKEIAEAGDFEATGEVKDGHGNVLSDKVQCGVYTSPVKTVQSKQHDAITFSANFPSTVFAAAIMNTLNAAYVFANVVKITPTEVQVGVYNDYTNALSGAFTIIYFYK
jgi:hypothetical protein